jgi:tetratricopeptide (TPR) repeat protein
VKVRPRPSPRIDRAARPEPRTGAAERHGTPRPPARLRVVLPSAATALLVYLPCIRFGFVRDDRELIAENPFLHSPAFLGQLLASDFWASTGGNSGLWRPLILLSYWLDGRLSGWSPAWFHAANVLAHAATSGLLAALVLAAGAGRTAALVAGLWFAVMPAHVESVAWIAGRTDVYSALFGLLALGLDARARARGRRWAGWAPLAAWLLALAAKESAVPLFGAIAVAAWIEGRRRGSRPGGILLWLAPYAAVAVSYLALHALAAGVPAATAPSGAGRGGRLAGWTMLPALLSFLLPWSAHGPDWSLGLPAGAGSPAVVGGALLHLGFALGLLALILRRKAAAVPVAVLWLPVLALSALAVARGYLSFGERHLYLPSAGAAWALGLAVRSGSAALRGRTRDARGTGWRTGVGVVAGGVIVSSAWATMGAMPAWRDELSMYAAMVAAQPSNATGHIGLAVSLADRGQARAAFAELAAAERLDSTRYEVPLYRAGVFAQGGDWARALESAERAIRLNPADAEAPVFRATALLRLGRLEELKAALDPLRRARPGDPDVERVWGEYALATGRPGDALPALAHAARWRRDDPELQLALGEASETLGRLPEARAAFERAIELAPGRPDGWLKAARVCRAVGDSIGAARALARAAALSRAPGPRPGRPERDPGGGVHAPAESPPGP